MPVSAVSIAQMSISAKAKHKHEVNRRRPGRPRNSDADPDMLREAFLNSAIRLFGARGFDGVSLSQISKDVGADIGLIRYYFGSKADLWEAAIVKLSDSIGNEVSILTRDQEKSASDQLKSVIRWFVQMSARWPQISRIIVFDGDNNNERGRLIEERMVRPFYTVFTELVRKAKAEGEIPDVAERTIFFMTTHGGSFPMALPNLTNAFPGGDINSEDALSEHAEAIISLIFSNSDK